MRNEAFVHNFILPQKCVALQFHSNEWIEMDRKNFQ